MQLGGARALVTGATGGIGHAIARALHERGARVLLSGRRQDALEELAARLGEPAEVVAADLAERDGPTRLAEAAGAVDVLVANAALPASGRVEDFDHDEIDRALDVNLRVPIMLAKLLSEGMAARGHGHLVFVSSMSGKAATVGGSVYSATKFGLRGFSLGLREDLRDSGVGVSTVFPGFISDAGMFHESGARLPGYVPTRTPEDVAAGVVRAIERNRSEVDVAPLSMRLGAAASGLIPELAGRIQRRLGSRAIADEMAEGQREKR